MRPDIPILSMFVCVMVMSCVMKCLKLRIPHEKPDHDLGVPEWFSLGFLV